MVEQPGSEKRQVQVEGDTQKYKHIFFHRLFLLKPLSYCFYKPVILLPALGGYTEEVFIQSVEVGGVPNQDTMLPCQILSRRKPYPYGGTPA